jgi:cellulose synthase/poly-beta-1,6-N-acetylglucosamine synthase-like glycosyltransferase
MHSSIHRYWLYKRDDGMWSFSPWGKIGPYIKFKSDTTAMIIYCLCWIHIIISIVVFYLVNRYYSLLNAIGTMVALFILYFLVSSLGVIVTKRHQINNST